ncbi:hypothetical protein AZE42_08835 [Rhizopogon vesiculosus]|uniref:Uncharacterized protein n=1 Tax=Rhizopogon vesiculosus TaxID=180088 RepID=A0A1J8Q8U7_9AGAM|nr:hypothetical protein AZE42_08835 [Rhizopogon vesiculosus]
MKGKNKPLWAESFRFFIFGTWFNVLLDVRVHTPQLHVSLLELGRWSTVFVQLYGDRSPAKSLGDTMSSLLNASLGNAAEIIVGMAAFVRRSDVVRNS